MAIICACIITYRPLIIDLHKGISRLSGKLSRAAHDTNSAGQSKDLEPIGPEWVEKQEKALYNPKLSAKLANKKLHFVHIDVVTPIIPMMAPFYQQPKHKHDLGRSIERFSKSKYERPPPMTKAQTVKNSPIAKQTMGMIAEESCTRS